MSTKALPRSRGTAVVRAVVTAVLAAILAVIGLTVPSPDAAAASGPYLRQAAATSDCVTNSKPGCQKVGSIPKGASVSMHCWLDGTWATGAYSSNRWFYVNASGKKGYVHSSWVLNQSTVPNCKSLPGAAAMTWAAEHVGETKPSATAASYAGIDDGMWSGWCAGFTASAYKFGAQKNLKYAFVDNARVRYNQYKNAGLMSPWTGGDILIGSQVFWPNAAAPYGHTAIYVGNGHVISTQGFYDPMPIKRLPVQTWGTPSGWVAPTKA